MVYANLAGYVVVTLSGFVLGAIFGRKLVANAMTMMHSVEARMALVEQRLAGNHGGSNPAAQHAAAVDHHVSAIEKLAGAIEKHAAAVDDHGAATVAAAVESRAGVLGEVAKAGEKN